MNYDKIIIGAGLYGLYSALKCGKNGQKVVVFEYDKEPFMRATYINQARVHMGYHYPRSYSTAIKSKNYFDKFNDDYSFCIHSSFDKIYATSSEFSWTSSDEFKKFCKDANIKCDDVHTSRYFKDNVCDGAFVTTEYTYDASILKQHLISEISNYSNIEIIYNSRIIKIEKNDTFYTIYLKNGSKYNSGFVLNATYASVNQILNMLNFDMFTIKYEICEIILCDVGEKLKNVGITVMDGPFFSIMPFGTTGFHSLTSVTFTPHIVSYDKLPQFSCQERSDGLCSKEQLYNCNDCQARPKTAYSYMSNLARKYLLDEYHFKYKKSLFSMKPILKSSEVDDSRPTVVKYFSENPTFVSVLSGKINTVYDLDEVLI